MKCKECGETLRKESGEFFTSIKTGTMGFCSQRCLLKWTKENKVGKLTKGSFSGGDLH